MLIKQGNLSVRNAMPSDAPQLVAWWNDGAVMAHAGFPNGLNEDTQSVERLISSCSDENWRLLIIEVEDKPVGEMNYKNLGDDTAEIGIKICDASEQNKGYGTRILRAFIAALFTELNFQRIVLDTNPNNLRAQRTYEKCGFVKTRVEDRYWQSPQTGEWAGAVFYELARADWELKKELSAFLDEQGRLTQFPAKRAKQLFALRYLADKTEPDKSYTEREINELLRKWHTFGDHVTLRRELVDLCLLARDAYGKEYKKA